MTSPRLAWEMGLRRADSSPPGIRATGDARPARSEAGFAGLTMGRLLTILYVVVCFEMGVLLFVFPWVSLWNKNFFVDHFPWLSGIVHNYFVRGAVSGVGLADVWLAVYELWRLRERLGLAQPRAFRAR